MELLKQIVGALTKTKWGQVLLGVLATLAIGASAIPADSPEAQGFGLAAGAVVVVVAVLLGPKAAAWLAQRFGGKPPATPGGAA